jgi:ketosteroid isomerase-like protein
MSTSSTFSREEIEEVHGRYLKVRVKCEAGEVPWSALAEFFTDDAYFVDPAWGRIDGIEAIRTFMDESMAGLGDWTFPTEFTVIEGNRLVTGWQNRLPGSRPDGSFYEAQGISVIEYAGNGKFSSERDLLNMVHVFELMKESGWMPGPNVNAPRQPVRRQ